MTTSARRALTVACTSPLGPVTLAAVVGPGLPPGGALAGCWFDGQRHDRAGLGEDVTVLTASTAPSAPTGTDAAPAAVRDAAPTVLTEAAHWLARYWEGRDPGPRPALAPAPTAFQGLVRAQLLAVPSGTTRTYGQLAAALEARTGRRVGARAVGTAVGRNPLSVLVPCHRVLGSDGALTGYAGGLERKTWLLRHEGLHVVGTGARARTHAGDPR